MSEHRSSKATSRGLRRKSYKNVLKSARSDNKKMMTIFSKLIHGFGMESIHEYLAYVLFNAKSLLVASLVGLVGTILSISMSEIYGYQYNYLLFIYFFLIGYVVTTIYLTITFRLKK
jgi:hypothetical protein